MRGPPGSPASSLLRRYCSRRGETVVGGISKLLSAFAREAEPDEIVTVIDRDWGEGGGWATLGFRPLRRLPPVTFFVGPDGRRCHLGAGSNPHRRRLPPALQAEASEAEGEGGDALVERRLARRGYFPVSDAGAERHLLVLAPPAAAPPAPQSAHSPKYR